MRPSVTTRVTTRVTMQPGSARRRWIMMEIRVARAFSLNIRNNWGVRQHDRSRANFDGAV
ncbi:MAG: hypothetical protein B7Z67_11675 [Acidiphilium sp. 21-60-14]|nr:MAG: hypothetical protein B7Z67_11675 [Acidiphilium sp. 21-60-14]OZB40512.1 MAG: hypothetical protein B7X48_04965 [Acidiphilium sp. 34-60-192]